MSPEHIELERLRLLSDFHDALCAALNELGGRADSLVESYRFFSAKHIMCAVDGYLELRSKGRIDASKLMIRPAIEMGIHLMAIETNPEVLFRIACKEFKEERKWVKAFPNSASREQEIDDAWASFKQAYSAKHPNHSLDERRITVSDIAELAGIGGYYGTHYALYCRFAHGAFRATSGGLNELETVDTCTMIKCALVALTTLSSLGVAITDLDGLKSRLDQLMP